MSLWLQQHIQLFQTFVDFNSIMSSANKESTPSGSGNIEQPSNIVRRFLNKDKTPLSILILSSIIGIVVGGFGSYFEIGVHAIAAHRTDFIRESLPAWVVWFFAFLISASLASIGYYLTQRFAPEAAGSGIPEIEGAMDNLRPVRWWRVLPVKFIGGLGSLGSGMILGREGPTVQMGGNIGRMMSDIFRLKSEEGKHSLLAAGAAAGLSAAFNAPLAGTMFVIEEMRPQFKYSLIAIKAVFLASITANIVFRIIHGQDAVIIMPSYEPPELQSLWLYLVLGILFGIMGVLFNKMVVKTLDYFAHLYRGSLWRRLSIGAFIGGSFGILLLYIPELTGGGLQLIPQATNGAYSLMILLALFIGRVFLTLVCFGSGAPGGIFAPMLAIGTLFGTFFGLASQALFPTMGIEPGTFAIAGMGALFAATVRAPLTGITLVIEMTNNYHLILPLLITCLGATMLAQLLGGRPIYSQLLERTLRESLRKQHKEEQDAEQQTPEADTTAPKSAP